MEIPDYEDMTDLAAWVRDNLDVGDDVAERVARELDAEANHDLGDPGELWQSIQNARGMIGDVGVDILSGVDVPAVDSTMLTMKAATGMVWGGERDVLLAKDADTEQRISYAAAMIPREPDKEGETVSTPTVEKAAHDYLKNLQGNDDGTGVDTDHNLIDDKGYVVESWVLKEDREFELPDGGTKAHKAGDWIVGIEWVEEAWKRVKSGDIEGISIYGTAEQVPLERARKDAIQKPTEFSDDVPDDIDTMSECIEWAEGETDLDDPAAFCQANNVGAKAKAFTVPFADEVVVHVVYESETAARKASEEMGLGGDIHGHTLDGMDVFMPGEDHEAFVDAYMELAEPNEENVNMDSYGGDDTEKQPEDDPCWEGYEMVGTKTDEFGNEVPRCVPKSTAKRLRKRQND